MNKYRNQPVELDGHKFSSKAEARRYQQLKLLERTGHIEALKLQPRFPIVINGIKVCTYVGDFLYTDPLADGPVCEDVKGMATRVYKIKKALMKAVHGIEIQEVQA